MKDVNISSRNIFFEFRSKTGAFFFLKLILLKRLCTVLNDVLQLKTAFLILWKKFLYVINF